MSHSASHKQTVTFTLPQTEYLRSEARIMGITFAEEVRRLIDAYRGSVSPSREIKFLADDQMISWIEEFYRHNRDDLDSLSEAIRVLVTSGIECQNVRCPVGGPGPGIRLTDEQINGMRLEALKRGMNVNEVVQDVIQKHLDYPAEFPPWL